MSFRAIESLRFQIIEFLIFWGIGFWWGGGVQKKLPAQSLREKRKITLTNFLVRNCAISTIPQIQIKCYRLLYYEKAY